MKAKEAIYINNLTIADQFGSKYPPQNSMTKNLIISLISTSDQKYLDRSTVHSLQASEGKPFNRFLEAGVEESEVLSIALVSSRFYFQVYCLYNRLSEIFFFV